MAFPKFVGVEFDGTPATDFMEMIKDPKNKDAVFLFNDCVDRKFGEGGLGSSRVGIYERDRFMVGGPYVIGIPTSQDHTAAGDFKTLSHYAMTVIMKSLDKLIQVLEIPAETGCTVVYYPEKCERWAVRQRSAVCAEVVNFITERLWYFSTHPEVCSH